VPKGEKIITVSRLSCRMAFISTGYIELAISLLLCTNGLREHCAHLVGPPFLAMNSVWVGSLCLRAMTSEGSLLSGCGYSHECVQDGCNGMCEVWMLEICDALKRDLPKKIIH